MCDVYLLNTHDDKSPFYVGESVRPEIRITEHITDTKCGIHKALRLFHTAQDDGHWEMRIFAHTSGKETALVLEAALCYLLQDQITNPMYFPTDEMLHIKPFTITKYGLSVVYAMTDHINDDVYQAVIAAISNVGDDERYIGKVKEEKLDWSEYNHIRKTCAQQLNMMAYHKFLDMGQSETRN